MFYLKRQDIDFLWQRFEVSIITLSIVSYCIYTNDKRVFKIMEAREKFGKELKIYQAEQVSSF